MFIKAKTLDDLLREVFKKLLKSKQFISATRGNSKELDGVLLELSNPRARLSRTERKGTIFSCLGELLWYLSTTNDLDFISYYIRHYSENGESEDGKTVYGGYGPRLFNMRGTNQIRNIISLLQDKPHTRRATVQLFNAEDLNDNHKEIPCTCTLQFLIRDKQLHMFTYMRSNDAYLGLPHDIFAFTMLQEILSKTLNVGLGKYKHSVGSLHLYTKHFEWASEFIDEGWQEKILMPPMPDGDPWKPIHMLLDAEEKIRTDEDVDLTELKLDEYWSDLARLLQIYHYLKTEDLKSVVAVKNMMSSNIYETYIRSRLNSKANTDIQKQFDLIKTDEPKS